MLERQLPGRTGAALQSALNQLHRSVEAGEVERVALLERATRDSLTGLLNRGAAVEALELDLAAVHRSQGSLVLALFFIDLDDLKSINDSIGHDAGDAAIQAVSEALRLTTRTRPMSSLASVETNSSSVGSGTPIPMFPRNSPFESVPTWRTLRSEPPLKRWFWHAVSELRSPGLRIIRSTHFWSGPTTRSTTPRPAVEVRFVGRPAWQRRIRWPEGPPSTTRNWLTWTRCVCGGTRTHDLSHVPRTLTNYR